MTPFKCNHDGACNDVRLCCTDTEMTLTRSDIRRIEALGFRADEFTRQAPDGFVELRNVDGLCYFYDPEKKVCRIYEHRPEGCRYYPVVYDYRMKTCVVDRDCPSGVTVTADEIAELCPRVRRLVETLVGESNDGDQ